MARTEKCPRSANIASAPAMANQCNGVFKQVLESTRQLDIGK